MSEVKTISNRDSIFWITLYLSGKKGRSYLIECADWELTGQGEPLKLKGWNEPSPHLRCLELVERQLLFSELSDSSYLIIQKKHLCLHANHLVLFSQQFQPYPSVLLYEAEILQTTFFGVTASSLLNSASHGHQRDRSAGRRTYFSLCSLWAPGPLPVLIQVQWSHSVMSDSLQPPGL